MAHSLGYPHPDLMLCELTSRQYQELLAFFRIEHVNKEEALLEAEQANIERFFDLAEAKQKDARQNG